MPSKIKGKLEAFCETGTLNNNSKEGYEALEKIGQGDYLIVLTKDKKEICWEGEITYSFEKNKIKQTKNPLLKGKQRIRNNSVYGIPEGINPEEWLNMFLNKLPAELIKDNQEEQE